MGKSQANFPKNRQHCQLCVLWENENAFETSNELVRNNLFLFIICKLTNHNCFSLAVFWSIKTNFSSISYVQCIVDRIYVVGNVPTKQCKKKKSSKNFECRLGCFSLSNKKKLCSVLLESSFPSGMAVITMDGEQYVALSYE